MEAKALRLSVGVLDQNVHLLHLLGQFLSNYKGYSCIQLQQGKTNRKQRAVSIFHASLHLEKSP